MLKENFSNKQLLIEYDAGFIDYDRSEKVITEMRESIGNASEGFSLENPVLYGVLQKADILNRNGRIYPQSILQREVEKYKDVINKGRAVGETDHPPDPVITISNVSFKIVDIWWEGKTLMGKIELPITRGYIKSGIISHPADKLAHDILNGIQYGVSSRGLGSVKSSGGQKIVQDDFELVCWDFVNSPSTIGSWMYGNQEGATPHIQKEGSDYKKNEQNKKISFADYLKSYNKKS